MTFSGDPFRALGLPAGASEAEIRRAYRALAKRFHPDSAGEGALPRFLAIQAAYDMLMTPNGRLRARAPGPTRASPTGAGPAGATGPTTSGGPGGPTSAGGPSAGSRADPNRTRATRESFRASRSRPAGTTGTGPTGGPAWWAAGRSGAAGTGTRPAGQGSDAGTGPDAADGAGEAGSAGAAGSAAPGRPPGTGARRAPGGPETRRSRAHRSATLGSTSYDDAPKEPEPEWNGATWYGDSSGTYWTVNPKEYADPRKHGPEYLARARRAAAGLPPDPVAPAAGPWTGDEPASAPPGAPSWTDPESAAGAAAAAANPDLEPPRPAAPDAGPGRPPRATRAAEFEARRARAAAWSSGSTGSTGTTWSGATARVAFDPVPPDDLDDDALAEPFQPAIPQRVVLALIAWPPLGLAAWAAIGELTGCGRAAATCSEPSSTLGWLVQPVILALLLLLPAVARPAAVASVAVGIAAVGGAALLSAFGGARAQASPAPTLLVAIIVMAYAVGLIGALSGKVPMPSWLNRSD